MKRQPVLLRRISGHSMMPVLPPGTLILGLGWLLRPRPGRVAVILHNGKEKIKRIADVKNGQVFVVGDHKEASTDSRHFGWLPEESIQAIVLWPRAPRNRAEGINS